MLRCQQASLWGLLSEGAGSELHTGAPRPVSDAHQMSGWWRGIMVTCERLKKSQSCRSTRFLDGGKRFEKSALLLCILFDDNRYLCRRETAQSLSPFSCRYIVGVLIYHSPHQMYIHCSSRLQHSLDIHNNMLIHTPQWHLDFLCVFVLLLWIILAKAVT